MELAGESNMKKTGRGIACMWYGVWGLPSVAVVKIDTGGDVTLITGEVDIGQGSDTILSQMVAEELGIALEKVNVVSGDSDTVPHTGSSSGSRVTYMGGNAVRRAAAEARRKIFAVAAEWLHATVEALEAKDGMIYVKGVPDKFVSFANVAVSIMQKDGPIVATGNFSPSTTQINPETGQGDPFQTYVYATQIADVEVDTETGVVRVLRITAAHDVGKAINPAFVEGQIFGGIATGLGQALTEDILIDKRRTLNPNFADYLIPTSMDMPEVQAIIVEENEPSGPFGAKCVGEPPSLPTAPAIINAIYDAVGVRIRDLPATPERVLQALREKKENS
jgi:CO/xanthine dehydrogenase Mo-binding subunit